MREELDAIAHEFESASERLRSLMAETGSARWGERPRSGGWSVGECIAHLNLTSEAFVPLLREGIARARAQEGGVSRRYRRDFTGWLIWRMSSPNGRFKAKTTAPFVPKGTSPPADLVADFERWQREQMACVRESDGLAIDRVKVTSPFDARVRYSVYAALTILPRHQHRHLRQAELVWKAVRTELS